MSIINVQEINGVNVIPTIAFTLGDNKKIYNLLDEIYKENFYIYLKVANESNIIDNPAVNCGSIESDIYAKKSVGIILGADNIEVFEAILEKGWKLFHKWAKSQKKINLKDAVERYFGRKKYIFNKFVSCIGIVFLECLLYNIELDMEDEESRKYFLFSTDGIQILRGKMVKKVTYNDYTEVIDETKNKISKILNIKNICSLSSIEKNEVANKIMGVSSLIADLEGLRMNFILDDFLSDKEVNDMIWAYCYISFEELREESIDVDEAFVSLVYLIFIKKLVKMYTELRNKYYEDNVNKTEIGLLNDEIERLKIEINKQINEKGILESKHNEVMKIYLTKSKDVLTQEKKIIYEQAGKIKELEDLLSKSQNEVKDLKNFLDELQYSVENIETETNEVDLEFINKMRFQNEKGLIFGGSDKWQNLIKKYLPNFKFIGADECNFDSSIMDKVDVIFINAKCASHALYYKVISIARKRNIKVEYINKFNKYNTLELVSKNLN